jgi:two-component sensor histidine kinase
LTEDKISQVKIEYDKNTESLGLQLVTNLVAQIDGTIDLNTSGGTTFKIYFCLQKKSYLN